MRSVKMSAILVLTLMVWLVPKGKAAPMGTAWTYQGRLMDANAPADGLYDFSFSLWSDPCDVNEVYKIGENLNIADWDVIDGYFTVELDFNDVNAFNGERRWLEIGIRPGELADPNAYTTLSWRMEVRPTPYALSLPGLRTEQNATSTNLIGGYSGNMVTRGVVGAVIGGGGENGFAHSVTDNYSTIGGGRYNQTGDDNGTADDASYAMVGGGSGNLASGKLSTVGGGYANQATAYAATVGGGQGNRAMERYAIVSGGNDNTASGELATVGGGKYNYITDDYGTVGGGESNKVYKQHATVGGGHYNTARGRYATVSGGDNNLASGHESAIGGGDDNYTDSTHSTVSGGHSNSASGHSSSVGGGWDNSARGSYSIIPGGYLNEADGNWSFAAGANAKARHDGSFVWADSDYSTEFVSTGSDQFLIRASGGVGIGTNSPTEALDINGTVKATAFIGDGNGLTNLQIDSGWTVSGNNVYSAVSGNVGIGTTNPNALLEIAGASADLDLTSTSGLGPMVTFDHLGSVGGGSTLGLIRFKWGVLNAVAQISASAGSDSVNQDNAYLRFHTASEGIPIERMRIDEDGNVGIGTTNPSAKLEVIGSSNEPIISGQNDLGHGVKGQTTADYSVGVWGYVTGSRSHGIDGEAIGPNSIGVQGESLSIGGEGVRGRGLAYDFYAAGPGINYGQASSIRWKNDVRPIDDPLDKVLRLRGVYFNWDAGHGGNHDVGMIAEEVGEVLPEIVGYEENSRDATGMDYGKLTPLLVEAVKELKGENERLKERVEALERIIRQNQSAEAM